MNLDLDLGQWIVIGLCAFMVLWFFVANLINRQRGIAVYRWLHRGLTQVGEISRSQWFGSSSSGARLLVEKAAKPFRQVEAVYLLEPRELLPYWIFSHLRGKRDEVLIQVSLRSAPKQEIEIGQSGDRAFSALVSADQKQSYKQVQAPMGLTIAQRGPEDGPGIDQLKEILEKIGAAVHRVSLHKSRPHLMLSLRIKPLLESPPESFLELWASWLQNL